MHIHSLSASLVLFAGFAQALAAGPVASNRIDLTISAEDYLTKWKPDLAIGAANYLGMKKFEFAPKSSHLSIQGNPLAVKKLALRGQSCKRAERKCVSVKAEKGSSKIEFSGVNPVRSSDFNLISMWQDEGYISNKIAYGLLNATGIIRLKTNYTTLSLHYPVLGFERTHEMGLYLVTEKPDKIMKEKFESPFVMRRGVNDKYETSFLSDQNSAYAQFPKLYEEMLSWAKTLHGQELYDRVSERLDIDAYFSWIVFNTLVRDQDYQDEVFFYADAKEAKKGRLYFRIFPWDYDDIFQDPQHGVLAQVKKRVTHPDSLDVAFAREPLFRAKYREVARSFLERMTESMIDQVASEVATDIEPYLRNDVLKVSARLDGKTTPHTPQAIRRLLQARVAELKSSRARMLGKI